MSQGIADQPAAMSVIQGIMADEEPGIDKLIHERTRLAIMSALSVNERLSFADLKRILSTSDGNLSVHARKLEDAGYLTATKSFERRIPRTEYALTAGGRTVFRRYLNHMEALIHAVRVR